MPRGGKREGAGRKKQAAKATAQAPDAQTHSETPAKASPLAVTLLRACTGREQAFILELVAHPDLTHREAFKRAGYCKGSSPESLDSNAAKVLKRDRVQAALTALRTDKLSQLAATAVMTGDEALERLSMYARADIGEVLGPDDSISKLPPHVRMAIKAVRPTREGRVIELYDAMRATELLAKAGGKLKEIVKVDSLEELIAASMQASTEGVSA